MALCTDDVCGGRLELLRWLFFAGAVWYHFNLSSLGRVFRIRLVLRLRQDAFAQELNKLAVVAGKSQVAGRLHGQLDYAPAVLAEHALMKQASMQ